MFDDMYPRRETGFERELSLETPELDFDFPADDFCGPIVIEQAEPIQTQESVEPIPSGVRPPCCSNPEIAKLLHPQMRWCSSELKTSHRK